MDHARPTWALSKTRSTIRFGSRQPRRESPHSYLPETTAAPGCDAPAGGVYSSGILAVNGIASTPYNVAVGGTQFDDTTNPSKYWSATNDPTTGESALSYIPEMAWNESSNDPNNVLLYAGSGGVSTLYAKPNLADWRRCSE